VVERLVRDAVVVPLSRTSFASWSATLRLSSVGTRSNVNARTHYFWAFMRNYRLESHLITTQLRDGVQRVFGEDEAMLAAQQAAIDATSDHEFYSLNIDAGGMWVPRILDRMLAAERGGDAPATTPDPVSVP